MHLRTHVVSEAQIEFLQDEQVPAEQRPGHGHVTDGLTDHRHGGAAAVQLRQADPGAQTCRTQRSVINNNNNNTTTSSSFAGRQTHRAGRAPLRPARRPSPGPSPSSAPSWLSSGYGRPAACSESPRSRYRCRRRDAGETITKKEKERKKDMYIKIRTHAH